MKSSTRQSSFAVLLLAAAVASPAFAQPGGGQGPRGNTPVADQGMMQQDRAHPYVYGYQLMTPQERTEYRTRMRSLKTKAERDAFRAQHHEQMRKRAAERGVTLPERPMSRGGGWGAGRNAPMSGKGMMQGGRMRPYIYGYQLMTPQERTEYRSKMRSLKTQAERDALRAEHHEQMRKRAAEKGITLPVRPMNRGRGQGAGPRSAPPANPPGKPNQESGSGRS